MALNQLQSNKQGLEMTGTYCCWEILGVGPATKICLWRIPVTCWDWLPQDYDRGSLENILAPTRCERQGCVALVALGQPETSWCFVVTCSDCSEACYNLVQMDQTWWETVLAVRSLRGKRMHSDVDTVFGVFPPTDTIVTGPPGHAWWDMFGAWSIGGMVVFPPCLLRHVWHGTAICRSPWRAVAQQLKKQYVCDEAVDTHSISSDRTIWSKCAESAGSQLLSCSNFGYIYIYYISSNQARKNPWFIDTHR